MFIFIFFQSNLRVFSHYYIKLCFSSFLYFLLEVPTVRMLVAFMLSLRSLMLYYFFPNSFFFTFLRLGDSNWPNPNLTKSASSNLPLSPSSEYFISTILFVFNSNVYIRLFNIASTFLNSFFFWQYIILLIFLNYLTWFILAIWTYFKFLI